MGVGKLYSDVRFPYNMNVETMWKLQTMQRVAGGNLVETVWNNRRGSHSSMKSSMALKKFEV